MGVTGAGGRRMQNEEWTVQDAGQKASDVNENSSAGCRQHSRLKVQVQV